MKDYHCVHDAYAQNSDVLYGSSWQLSASSEHHWLSHFPSALLSCLYIFRLSMCKQAIVISLEVFHCLTSYFSSGLMICVSLHWCPGRRNAACLARKREIRQWKTAEYQPGCKSLFFCATTQTCFVISDLPRDFCVLQITPTFFF